MAGVYTGAVTLIWAMVELARNPEIMKNAQEEVRNVVRNRERVAEMISNFKINDCDIYPKSLIHVNVWAIGRDPNYWKDPEDLFPEKFIDSFIDFKGQHFELLPFGAGRRGCPALHMGTVLIELALVNLLHCFDSKLPNGVQDINMEEQARPSLTISKMDPLKLVPVRYLVQ
ncbi:cytochrome P450 71B34-like [Ricinus communis]|uniref:cytochrome P450 71B34-like n=1 Tax=Ricinus communis TaxID=3988 RepID=UPI00201AE665|nr:cytochrome P450 71B34-like [Ricinus communis]